MVGRERGREGELERVGVALLIDLLYSDVCKSCVLATRSVMMATWPRVCVSTRVSQRSYRRMPRSLLTAQLLFVCFFPHPFPIRSCLLIPYPFPTLPYLLFSCSFPTPSYLLLPHPFPTLSCLLLPFPFLMLHVCFFPTLPNTSKSASPTSLPIGLMFASSHPYKCFNLFLTHPTPCPHLSHPSP